jgi:hypothetical protein
MIGCSNCAALIISCSHYEFVAAGGGVAAAVHVFTAAGQVTVAADLRSMGGTPLVLKSMIPRATKEDKI